MGWLNKISFKTDTERISFNIDRLLSIKSLIHELAYVVIASNSSGYRTLESILEIPIVKDREKLYSKLKSALIGQNNQKIALDSPMKFQRIMFEAEVLVGNEIMKEQIKLKKIPRQ